MQHPVYLDRCPVILMDLLKILKRQVATGGRCWPPMGVGQRTGACLTPVHV